MWKKLKDLFTRKRAAEPVAEAAPVAIVPAEPKPEPKPEPAPEQVAATTHPAVVGTAPTQELARLRGRAARLRLSLRNASGLRRESLEAELATIEETLAPGRVQVKVEEPKVIAAPAKLTKPKPPVDSAAPKRQNPKSAGIRKAPERRLR